MSTSPKVTLISFALCPFVERSRVVLEEKGVPYEIQLIDLKNKPEWFLNISPRGKVPVLLLDDEPFFESGVINELLEELFPEPPMLPLDPRSRAQDRAWIAFNNDALMPNASRIWFSSSAEKCEAAHEILRTNLVILERRLSQRSEGPYFSGSTFGLVDATYAPLFTRWGVIAARKLSELRSDFPLFSAYIDAVLARKSVQAAQADDLVAQTLAYKVR